MKSFTIIVNGEEYMTRPSQDDAERIAAQLRRKGHTARVVSTDQAKAA